MSEAGGKAIVQVNRINGADGTVSVGWETKDLTAVDGKDYIGGVGSLTFEHGETSKQFDFTVLDNGVCFKRFSDFVRLNITFLMIIYFHKFCLLKHHYFDDVQF